MSVHVQSLVYSRKFGGGIAKLVALKLADHASDDGGNIFPSQARLAAECEISERQVRRILSDFIELGLLSKVAGEGGGRDATGRGITVRYAFDLAAVRALPQTYPDTVSGLTRTNPDTQSGITRTDSPKNPDTQSKEPGLCVRQTIIEPSLEPSEEVEATASPSPPPRSFPTSDDIEFARDLWNDMADQAGLARVAHLSDQRRAKLRQRLKTLGSREAWHGLLERVYGSPFCRGENDRGWRADFDFVLQEKSFNRLLEGFYATRPPEPKPRRRVAA